MGGTISTSATKLDAFTLQSSAYGVTIPLVYGRARVAGNMLWYGGFTAVPHTTSQGGKGGIKTQNTTFSYTASVIMGVCHGQISDIPRIWKGKTPYVGGWLPAQIITTGETYTPPSTGAMVYNVAHITTYLSLVAVYATVGGRQVLMAEGNDYAMTNGVLTVLADMWRGTPITVQYQWGNGTRSQTAMAQLGLSFSPGYIGQPIWSVLTAYTPPGGSMGDNAIGYSGIATVMGMDYDLGTGAQIENHTFEVLGPLAYHLGSTIPDADPSLVLRDVLSDVNVGAAFPALAMPAWTDWSNWCVANSVLISPVMDTQVAASDIVTQMCKLTNTVPVWSGGQLKMVPYGDTAATGNGVTFTPNTTPVYDLDEDCWIAESGQAPVKYKFKRPADRFNHFRVEYLDRSGQYNPTIAEAWDLADISRYGLRSAEIEQAHWLCTTAAAQQVAQTLLQRSLHIVATMEATLPWHFALLEPGDIVTLTDASLSGSGYGRTGVFQRPVRVQEIDEAETGELKFTFEECPGAVNSAAVYTMQPPSGYQPDYAAAPGSVDTPVFFEYPGKLSMTGLRVCAAVRGVNAAWGGCQVWVSLDGTTYRQVGVQYGSARYGTLSANAAGGAGTISVQGVNNPLLNSSSTDATALNSLCYVASSAGANPEYFAYTTATFVSAGAYTLTVPVHGAYATGSPSHSSGDNFVRVDDRIANSGDLDLSLIGATIHFKFLSFNIYGKAQQSLADATDYTYVITGDMATLQPSFGSTVLKLSAQTVALAADSTGYVASFSLATSTATVETNNIDVTSAWTITKADGPGITSTLSGNQVLVTAMSSDVGYITFTATRTGWSTLTARFTVNKVRSSGTTGGGGGAPVAGPYFLSDAIAHSAVLLNTDGTVSAKDTSGTYQPAGNWYAPTTAGIGSSYWVQAAVTSGSGPTSGTIGSRVALSSAVGWANDSTSGFRVHDSVLTYSLYTAATGGSAVATGTIEVLSDNT